MFQLVCASGLEWLSKAPSQIDLGRSKNLTFEMERKLLVSYTFVALWTYFPSGGPNILVLLSLAFKPQAFGHQNFLKDLEGTGVRCILIIYIYIYILYIYI